MMRAPDPEQVLAALGWQAAAPPQPVAGGLDTVVWRFVTADGRAHALRLFRLGEERTAAREQLAMQVARAARLPVPAIEAAGAWQDRPALVMVWAAGTPLANAVARRPPALWRLGLRFGRLQARLHQVPAPPALVADPHTFLHGVLERGNQPSRSGGPPALLHMDYHPLNVLSDGRRLTAIIDWANVSAGDPRPDIARTFAILRGAPLPPGPPRAIMQPARLLLAAAWRRGYQRVAGNAAFTDLGPWVALMGQSLLAEMAPRVSDPTAWVTERDMERLRQWLARQMTGP